MKKIYYITYSALPSFLPSSLQIIKTCESFSKNKYKITLIKPGTGNKKISIKKYYGLKHNVEIKEFTSIDSFPQGFRFYLYSFYCLFFLLKKKKLYNNYKKLFCLLFITIV